MTFEKFGAIGRRSVLGIAVVAALPISIRFDEAQAAALAPGKAFSGVRAMTFDIAGTLFDYYKPFIRISTRLGAQKGLTQDWPSFLQDWNAGVGAIIQAIASGKQSWVSPGQVFRAALDQLLTGYGLASQFDENDRRELMSVWGQMVPWPDSVEGAKRLKRHFTVAALSNAGMSTLISVAKRSGLPLDAVLSGELVHAYKPTLDVYQSASTYLGFPPEQIIVNSRAIVTP
ncbi:MAG: haloacid dehalogenase type II [Bradyrhizobium sp.]|nr:haloacid dehalogenase type II [Bradyrhizobium sp.]